MVRSTQRDRVFVLVPRTMEFLEVKEGRPFVCALNMLGITVYYSNIYIHISYIQYRRSVCVVNSCREKAQPIADERNVDDVSKQPVCQNDRGPADYRLFVSYRVGSTRTRASGREIIRRFWLFPSYLSSHTLPPPPPPHTHTHIYKYFDNSRCKKRNEKYTRETPWTEKKIYEKFASRKTLSLYFQFFFRYKLNQKKIIKPRKKYIYIFFSSRMKLFQDNIGYAMVFSLRGICKVATMYIWDIPCQIDRVITRVVWKVSDLTMIRDIFS